jgi:hypothetical protein
MSNITTPASGDLNVNISSLFNEAANAINTGIRMGNAFANITGGDTSTQQAYDPNSRIMNQNPYGTNPYAQVPVYQSANYGYGYGNIGGVYSMNDYQNGVYPGISNPNYGM